LVVNEQDHKEIEREMARLVVNREGVDLLIHQLNKDVITIGRAPLNHIVIDQPTVSAQHAILARFGDSYRLEDLSSTNGTQINGVRVNIAEVKDGDKILFGSVIAVFLDVAAKFAEKDRTGSSG
jgi:pSer/pThr/pTyr-binding forkhead associated (FHA) protein